MSAYRLVEIDAGKPLYVEEFQAPDDAEALRRVRDVVETFEFELWRGPVLVERQQPPKLVANG